MINFELTNSEFLLDIEKNFPKNPQSLNIMNNSPFQSESIFQEEEIEIFPLEKKHGKALQPVIKK